MTSWRVSMRARVGTLNLDVDLQGACTPLALIGPNGSGKTTLLRMVTGALNPIRGEIEVGGTLLFSSRRSISLPSEQRRMGYVPQGYGLFPHLRVIDNVAFGLSTGARKRTQKIRRSAAMAILEELDCVRLAAQFPQRLSGGEQQRVALARALVIEPAMLLLDEPLAALDAGARRTVRVFLTERLRSLGCPSIVVTHDARDVAALEARICVIERGQIIQEGDLEDLRAAPGSDFVAEFVASAPFTPRKVYAAVV